MKLFDCTTYFEEDMMMEIRFNILNQYVDKFVVCEANFSHSGSKKKINFNKDNFPKFKKKIIHIILKNEPKNLENNINSDPSIARSNSIKRINFQRDYIIKGLNEARADDFIMYSDNDEIPDLSNVDFKNTSSCYNPMNKMSCGKCDSCLLRKKGFENASVEDKISYRY